MILTCPSCGTRYVVKDGAIPPAGRTVRCAQCKHSWHQEPEATEETDDAVVQAEDQAGGAQAADHPFGDDSQAATATGFGDTAPSYEASDQAVDEPLPEPAQTPSAGILSEREAVASMPEEAAAAPDPYPEAAVPFEPGPEPDLQSDPEPIEQAPRTSHPLRAARMETEDLYSPFATQDEEDEPRRRWPIVAGVLLLLVVLVAAGVYFLAPAELKGRLGIAQSDSSEDLTIQVQNQGRTQLASGNQLYEVSGVVRNETDQPLPVPPMNAQLRSLEQKVVYRWTIPISPPQLAPGASASFNSANLDVPEDAACLEVFFGKQRDVARCRPVDAAGA